MLLDMSLDKSDEAAKGIARSGLKSRRYLLPAYSALGSPTANILPYQTIPPAKQAILYGNGGLGNSYIDK